VAHHDALLAELMDIGSEPQAQGLDPQRIDLGPEQPARVVFAEARGLHQREILEIGSLNLEVGTRGGEHRNSIEPV
jgi:hypothetical protein